MRATVLLSGGMDSTALVTRYVRAGIEVHALTVNYGQRHRKEIEAAKRVAAHLTFLARQQAMAVNLNHEVIEVPFGILENPDSSQTGFAPVPHGRYDEESMKATVVPNRNMFLLSIAVARAIANGSKVVGYAAHAGDHAIYPDCRPQFITAMRYAIQECDWNPPALEVPFQHLTKAEIAAESWRLGAPLHLTWTCYEGNEVHCGRCGTCVERLEAFHLAGLVDPVPYVDREYWKSVVNPR